MKWTVAMVVLGCFVLLPLMVQTGNVPCGDCGPGRMESAQMVVDPFTLFPGGPGAGDAAQGFDGSNDRYDATNWYPADSDRGIISFWLRRDSSGSIHVIHSGLNNRYQIAVLATDIVRILLNNVAGTVILNMDSGSTTITDTNWHHVLASWKLQSGSVEHWLYVDDVDVKSLITGVAGTAEWTRSTNRIGANATPTPNSYVDGCLSEFYIQIGEYLDLSVTANRRLFIDASLNPVNVGADGSTPTGVQPEVYLPGDDFTDNKGTNANLSETGTPVACSNTPG